MKNQINKIILLVVIFLVIISAVVILVKFSKPSPKPNLNDELSNIAPGDTKDKVIDTLGNPNSTLSSGTLFEYYSNNPNSNHKITIDPKTNKIILIKEIISLKNEKTSKFITDKFGTATISLYGPESSAGIKLFVYPDKGIAYVGWDDYELINEIWYFEPTDINTFKIKFADDYSEEISHGF